MHLCMYVFMPDVCMNSSTLPHTKSGLHPRSSRVLASLHVPSWYSQFEISSPIFDRKLLASFSTLRGRCFLLYLAVVNGRLSDTVMNNSGDKIVKLVISVYVLVPPSDEWNFVI